MQEKQTVYTSERERPASSAASDMAMKGQAGIYPVCLEKRYAKAVLRAGSNEEYRRVEVYDDEGLRVADGRRHLDGTVSLDVGACHGQVTISVESIEQVPGVIEKRFLNAYSSGINRVYGNLGMQHGDMVAQAVALRRE